MKGEEGIESVGLEAFTLAFASSAHAFASSE